MATAFDNRDSKKTGMTLIILISVIILVIAFLVGGIDGFFGILKVAIYLAMTAFFFGFIVYIVYFLFFKKHPRNIPYENWKSYLRSGLDNGPDMMEELILTGDKQHSAKRFMTIMGYLRIMGFDGKEYDMFIGKKSPKNPFEEHKIVMIEPGEHSDLIGDVYIEGMSLILKYGYYFLNTNMLNFNAIDKFVALDTLRTATYDTLGDMKGFIDRATALDADFVRRRAEDKLLKIPTLQGQQPPQNNG